MKAITTITLMAMLVASGMTDDFDGGVYDSGYAVFSGVGIRCCYPTRTFLAMM